jgi:hypothetical protein
MSSGDLLGLPDDSLGQVVSTAEQTAEDLVSGVSEGLSTAEKWVSEGLSAAGKWASGVWNGLGDTTLPPWLVKGLALAGVNWPNITRKDILDFAELVRQFGSAVEATHDDATQAVDALANVFKGAWTPQAMQSGWVNLATYVDDLVGFCQVLAQMLESASQVVTAMKAAAIVDLGEETVVVVGASVSFVLTGGLSAEAAEAVIPLVQNAVNALEQQIIQEVVDPVISRALEPVIDRVASLAAGMDWAKAAATVGAQVGVDIDPVAAENALQQIEALAGKLQERMAPVTAGLQALPFA